GVPTGIPAAKSESAGMRTTPAWATVIFTAGPEASCHWSSREPGRAGTGETSAGARRRLPCSGTTAAGEVRTSAAERRGGVAAAGVAEVHRVLPSLWSDSRRYVAPATGWKSTQPGSLPAIRVARLVRSGPATSPGVSSSRLPPASFHTRKPTTSEEGPSFQETTALPLDQRTSGALGAAALGAEGRDGRAGNRHTLRG